MYGEEFIKKSPFHNDKISWVNSSKDFQAFAKSGL